MSLLVRILPRAVSRLAIRGVAWSFALGGAAVVGTSAADEASGTPLQVIELFTSHGCSSCPPADALLGELLDADPDLIALEFHVDYWNRLVHGSDGNWVDPFSDPLWTQRQRDYDMAPLDGRRGIYTPQAIVNGRVAAVGSDEARIRAALDSRPAAAVEVGIEQDGDGLQAIVGGGAMDADVWLVRYLESATTEIGGGENRDRTLTNHRIVRSMTHLGSAGDVQQRFDLALPAAGEGCVVLVQPRSLGPLIGAASCS